MPTRFRQIPLAEAAPGMTLSDPVLDTKGNVLLPEQTVLTTTLLSSLARHEIATIAIRGEPLSPAEADADMDRRIARVEWLFRAPAAAAAGGDPAAAPDPATATEELHRYLLNFRSGMTT